VADLQAILDPSVPKSSSLATHRTVDEEEESSEDQAGYGDGGDDFFDRAESPDDHIDDDGWESGSIHSESDGPSTQLRTTSADSDSESESESDSTSDADSPGHSGPMAKSKQQLKPELVSEDNGDESTPDSDSDTLPSPPARGSISKPSGAAGTSTFLPSLSVGYIPGTGDSDPEDELEVMQGKNDRKNRRGQRARRA